MKTEQRYNNASRSMLLLKLVRCRKVSRGYKGVEGTRPYANSVRHLCVRGVVEGGGDHPTARNGGLIRHNWRERESFGCTGASSGYYHPHKHRHQGGY